MAHPELVSLLNDTRSWFAIVAEEEHRQTTRLLRMTAAEWKEEGKRIIRAWRGHDIRPCLDYLDRMDREREAFIEEQTRASLTAVVPPPTDFDRDYLAWVDVTEEPWKYGDSALTMWVEVDAKLTSGPGRWRVGAYWCRRQEEVDALSAPWRELYSQIAKEAAVAGERAWIRRDIKRHVTRFKREFAEWTARRNAAATLIAAAVRGHQSRAKSPYLNCCMCLSHRISPIYTEVGHMCRTCAVHGVDTGPLTDPWARK